MKTVPILFSIVGLSAFALGRGLAAEPSSARVSHENHSASVRPGETPRDGRSQIDHDGVKSIQAGQVHTPIKPALRTETLPYGIKRAAAAPHNELKMNKMPTHYEPVAKLPEEGGKIVPKPIIGHGSAKPTSIGGLSMAGRKHSTAGIDGGAFRRKP
jgi:hypothetical protein